MLKQIDCDNDYELNIKNYRSKCDSKFWIECFQIFEKLGISINVAITVLPNKDAYQICKHGFGEFKWFRYEIDGMKKAEAEFNESAKKRILEDLEKKLEEWKIKYKYKKDAEFDM
jgi:hypothetical protein